MILNLRVIDLNRNLSQSKGSTAIWANGFWGWFALSLNKTMAYLKFTGVLYLLYLYLEIIGNRLLLTRDSNF